MGVGGQRSTLPPGNRPRTHCVGGCVGPRVVLDVCEKSKICIMKNFINCILTCCLVVLCIVVAVLCVLLSSNMFMCTCCATCVLLFLL